MIEEGMIAIREDVDGNIRHMECECGFEIDGDTELEISIKYYEHLEEAHPQAFEENGWIDLLKMQRNTLRMSLKYGRDPDSRAPWPDTPEICADLKEWKNG